MKQHYDCHCCPVQTALDVLVSAHSLLVVSSFLCRPLPKAKRTWLLASLIIDSAPQDEWKQNFRFKDLQAKKVGTHCFTALHLSVQLLCQEEIRRQLPPTRSISHHTCGMDDFTVCKHNKRGITHNWLLSDLSFSQGLTPGRPLPCQYVFASERLCELCPASHSSAIPPLSSLDFPTEP